MCEIFFMFKIFQSIISVSPFLEKKATKTSEQSHLTHRPIEMSNKKYFFSVKAVKERL